MRTAVSIVSDGVAGFSASAPRASTSASVSTSMPAALHLSAFAATSSCLKTITRLSFLHSEAMLPRILRSLPSANTHGVSDWLMPNFAPSSPSVA